MGFSTRTVPTGDDPVERPNPGANPPNPENPSKIEVLGTETIAIGFVILRVCVSVDDIVF